MVDASTIVTNLQFTMFSIIILLTLVYSIPHIFIPRFRDRIHAFTLNVCMAILCCSMHWFVSIIIVKVNVRQFYHISTCSIVFYAQIMCTLQVPLALMVVSIHRLCCVLYFNRTFFKSKLWICMCILCQWLVGILISLPIFIRNPTVKKFSLFDSSFSTLFIGL
ncbi:hypothetical protein I4U23_002446 [Adineta vaga]|nr:hypothetical protein I4U23_002446 [Adineta vaga]